MIETDFKIRGQEAWEYVNCPSVRFEAYVVKRNFLSSNGTSLRVVGVFSSLSNALEVASRYPHRLTNDEWVTVEDYQWVILPGHMTHTLQKQRLRLDQLLPNRSTKPH